VTTGKLEKIINWAGGKGGFLRVADGDYFFFGKLPLHEGDEIEFETAAGTGNFADKTQAKNIRLVQQEKPESAEKKTYVGAQKNADWSGFPQGAGMLSVQEPKKSVEEARKKIVSRAEWAWDIARGLIMSGEVSNAATTEMQTSVFATLFIQASREEVGA
jgi:hypothetical protein